jgi:hypothetical protein
MRPCRYDHKTGAPAFFRLVIPNVAERSEESFNPVWLICSAKRKDSSACGFGMTVEGQCEARGSKRVVDQHRSPRALHYAKKFDRAMREGGLVTIRQPNNSNQRSR